MMVNLKCDKYMIEWYLLFKCYEMCCIELENGKVLQGSGMYVFKQLKNSADYDELREFRILSPLAL